MPRGGDRDGAGRKKLPPEEKRVKVCFTVSPELKLKINEIPSQGKSELIESLLAPYFFGQAKD